MLSSGHAPTIGTRFDPEDPSIATNAATMARLVEELRERTAAAALGGSQAQRDRHVGRGKLLPRDRVVQLLHHRSPVRELSPRAAPPH